MNGTQYMTFKAVWLCALGITIGLLAQRTDALLKELTADSAKVAKNGDRLTASAQMAIASIQGIELNTTRTEAEMAGLLNQTRHSMMTPAQTKELVDRAANLMDNANLSVIRFGAAAQSLEGLGPTTQGAIAQFAQDAHGTLKAATDDLADPQIKTAIQNVATTSANVQDATANVADTTKDIRDYVRRATTPARGFWNAVKWIINQTWAIRGAAGI